MALQAQGQLNADSGLPTSTPGHTAQLMPDTQASDVLRHMYMELSANANGTSLYPKEAQSALPLYLVNTLTLVHWQTHWWL